VPSSGHPAAPRPQARAPLLRVPCSPRAPSGSARSPRVSAAATGLGLLGGTGMLAFGDIASALSAKHSASTSIGLTAAQTTSTNYSNSVQVRQAQAQAQAQEQVSQARRQAGEDAITSDQAIQQAERNASASQISAVQTVAQAKQGVEQADYGLTEAEYNLGRRTSAPARTCSPSTTRSPTRS
jgi:hypothetical protein